MTREDLAAGLAACVLVGGVAVGGACLFRTGPEQPDTLDGGGNFAGPSFPLFGALPPPDADLFARSAFAHQLGADPANTTTECIAPSIERVAAFALSLPSAFRRNGVAAQEIDLARDWLQMGRINAASIAAMVVEVHAFRDGTVRHFVGEAVREYRLAVNESESSVTIAIAAPEPQRASGVRFGATKALKAFFWSPLPSAAQTHQCECTA